jgi:PAS domain S-box-containing protein
MSEPLRLLLVDDEAGLREPLARFLRENHSYVVETAADGEQAWARVTQSERPYHVALIDDQLTPRAGDEPRPFGIELMKRIKSLAPQTEVIIFTGWGMARALEALRAGAFRYLAKPFNVEELAITIQHAAEYQLLKGYAREKQILERLMETSTASLSSRNQQEALNHILRGIQAIGFDRVRLYLHSDNGESLVGKAQAGMDERFVGVKWAVADDVYTQTVIADRLPHVFKREAGKPAHSEEFLDKDGVEEWACVPLMLRGKVIGTLAADNKFSRRPIVDQELIPVALFASQVAAAIELNEQKDHLARLIAGSPNGTIAIDAQGNVTGFNKRAEEILGYGANEVLGKPVGEMYFDPREPRKIGRKLHESANGRVTNHETSVKNKDGQAIPVRHSSTWLYDSNGKRIGSVGYFEDLRQVKETERRLEFILKANNIVAQAKNMADGLRSLAEMVVTLLDTSFCRIFLLDESRQFLETKAAAVVPRSDEGLKWNPGLEERTAIAEWKGLSDTLAQSGAIVLKINGRRSQPVLKEWSRRLGLKDEIQSLLVIPLRTKNGVVGLLDLGELRHWDQSPISEEKKELAAAIANQIALLVDHLRLHEITERRGQMLATLDAKSRRLSAEMEPARLLQEVVCLGADLVEATAGCIYINYPDLKELKLSVNHQCPVALFPNQLQYAANIFGSVAQTGKSKIVREYAGWPGHQAMIVPLKQSTEMVAVLLIADSTDKRLFTEIDLEILDRFAARAALTLQASRLFAQLGILHKISDYIQATGDLNKIFHVVLTGITAGYGLGFNRAAAFLLDEQRQCLVGRMGIGCLNKPEAERHWKLHHESGMENFEKYRKQLEQEALPLTPLEKRIRGISLPVRTADPDLFSKLILKPRGPLFLTQDDLETLPASFTEAFEPVLPLVAVPLLAKNQAIGIIVADTKFTQAPITPEDVESLQTFANAAATAVDNARLFRETKTARERLRSLFEASNALVSSESPQQTLQDVVEQTRVAANASWVRLVLIDETGQKRHPIDVLAKAGTDQELDFVSLIRPNGISMQVLRTGNAQPIEDTSKQQDWVNPTMLQEGSAAALCLPMSLQGTRIGVMWIHYDKPRHFSKSEIDALQLYVNHAAIAYDGARRVEELKQLSQAAQAMSKVSDLKQTLQTIVEEAAKMFKADFSTIWPYDSGRDQFLPEELEAVGHSEKQLQKFRVIEPARGGTTYTVLQKKWISVHDISISDYPFLKEPMRRLLKQSGIASFQGIALEVGNEPIGVLYTSYKQTRTFGEEDSRSLESFAAHAALALRNARLLDQVNKAKTAAQVVAGVIALGENLNATLDSIAKDTHKAVRCDAVVLYAYDQTKDGWNYPPTHAGVRHPKEAWPNVAIPPTSIVYKILGQEKPYIVESTAEDKLLPGSRFARDEEVKSYMAIALKAGGQKVGVMFVNHRTQHRFTAEELSSIELFANQAAVAIRNAHLHERIQKRARALQALYETGKALSGSLDLSEILNRIAEQAWHLAGCRISQTNFASIGLVEEMRAKLVATYPSEELAKMREILGEEGYLWGETNGRIGIIGRVIKTGEPQRIADVARDPDYWEYHRDIHSELAVPIKIGGEVIGVINVEHTERYAFDEDDQHALEALAAQASIAIQNARSFEELKRIKGFVGSRTAEEWMRMVSMSWGHGIRREVGTASGQVAILRNSIGEDNMTQEIQTELEKLEALVKGIGDIPIIAPLSYEDAVDSVQINDLVKTYLDRQWKHSAYKSVILRFAPQEGLDSTVTVLASQAWLRQALEILVGNAVQAMLEADSPQKLLTVTTRIASGTVEISVKDTGPGIQDAIYEQLFKKPIYKPPGSRGAGIGLMLAQTIVQTYQGDICVRSRGNGGTDMVITLPGQTRKISE